MDTQNIENDEFTDKNQIEPKKRALPKDKIYRGIILKILEPKLSENERWALKQKANEQFARFNGFELARLPFSLNELKPGMGLGTKEPERCECRPGNRTCYLKDGRPFAVMLHIDKGSFDLCYLQAMAYKLDVKMYVVSSFINPGRLLGAVFTRREDLIGERSAGNNKPGRLFSFPFFRREHKRCRA